jgi:hypothetical protein
MEEEEGRKIAGLCGGRVTDAMRRYSKRRRIHRFHCSSSFSDWMRAEVLRSSARRRQTRQLITVLRVCVCGGIHPSSHTHNAPSSTHFLDGKKIKSFFKTTLFFGEFKLFFNLFLPANDFRFYKSIDPSTLSAFRFEDRNIVSNCCKLSFLTYVIWLFTFI